MYWDDDGDNDGNGNEHHVAANTNQHQQQQEQQEQQWQLQMRKVAAKVQQCGKLWIRRAETPNAEKLNAQKEEFSSGHKSENKEKNCRKKSQQ